MKIEVLCRELEQALADLCFSGLKNAPPAALQKLDGLGRRMEDLGLSRGGELVADFSKIMRDYRLGAAPLELAVEKLCALDFYEKTVASLDG